MALKFSRKERTYIPKWADNDKEPENDQISVDFKPLTVEDMFIVQKETKANLFGGMDIDREDPESFEMYWNVVKTIIGKYTSNWKNIIIDDQEVSDPTQVIEALGTGEMELLNEVFNHIIEDSSGTVDEEKNSESESGHTSLDSDLAVENALPPTFKEKEIVAETT